MVGLFVTPDGPTDAVGDSAVSASPAVTVPCLAPVADMADHRSRIISRRALAAGSLLVVGVVVAHTAPSALNTAGRALHLLAQPRWAWVVAAGAACVLTHVMAAVALSGATARHVPFGPTFMAQFASSLCNRLVPAGLGGMATNARYLCRCGLDRPAAVAAVGLNAAAGFVVHAACITVVVPIAAPGLLAQHHLPVLWLAVGGTVGAAGLVCAVARTASGQGRLVRACSTTGRGLLDTLRCGRRAVALFGGSAGITAAYGAAWPHPCGRSVSTSVSCRSSPCWWWPPRSPPSVRRPAGSGSSNRRLSPV